MDNYRAFTKAEMAGNADRRQAKKYVMDKPHTFSINYENLGVEEKQGIHLFIIQNGYQSEKYFIENVITESEVVYIKIPASKQEERDALAKIKKIVADLGKNSYIAAAFEGVFELAECNIENDFGCKAIDWKRMADNADERVREVRGEKEGLIQECDRLAEQLQDMKECCDIRGDTIKKREQELKDANNRAEAAEEELEKARAELVKLKAKLYDMLCAS